MLPRATARRSACAVFATAIVVVAAAVFTPPAYAQQRVALPGTSVTLTVPPGFALARDGKGLEDSASGSTIAIAERPAAAYADLAARFSSAKSLSEGYAAQGVTIRAVRQLTVNDSPVTFAVGRQVSQGQPAETLKYLALLKGDKTVLVTFTITDRGFSEADAEAVIRSIALTPAPTPAELLATLSFTFREIEPFRIANVRARAAATLAAGSGTGGSATEIVIGRGNSGAAMGEEAQVAVDLLKNTSGLRDAEITRAEPAPFAGGTGYVVQASVGSRTVVQYLRIVPGGGYLRLLARGEAGAIQDAAAAIAAIADSVELR